MKIKWVELTEDDPIFKSGFIISSPTVRNPQKKVTSVKMNKEKDKQRQDKKRGIKSPSPF